MLVEESLNVAYFIPYLRFHSISLLWFFCHLVLFSQYQIITSAFKNGIIASMTLTGEGIELNKQLGISNFTMNPGRWG